MDIVNKRDPVLLVSVSPRLLLFPDCCGWTHWNAVPSVSLSGKLVISETENRYASQVATWNAPLPPPPRPSPQQKNNNTPPTTNKQTNKRTNERTNEQTNKQTSMSTQTCAYTHKQTDTGRQTDRQTGRQTDRQTDRHTHTHTHSDNCRCTYVHPHYPILTLTPVHKAHSGNDAPLAL